MDWEWQNDGKVEEKISCELKDFSNILVLELPMWKTSISNKTFIITRPSSVYFFEL